MNSGNAKGILWVIAAVGALTLVTFLTKLVISDNVSAGSAVFIRTGFLLIFFSPMILIKRGRFLKTRYFRYHIMRGFFFGTSALCSAYAISHMSLSEANAFLLSTPIIMLPLCAIFLGERINVRKAIAICIGFSGVLVLLQPDNKAIQLAALFALAGATAEACNGVLLKKAVMSESQNTTIFWSFTFTFLISGIFCGFDIPQLSRAELGLLALAGATNLMVITFYIWGYKSGEAGVVEMGSFSVLIFSGVFDLMVFQILPGKYFLPGALLIVISAVIAVTRFPRTR